MVTVFRKVKIYNQYSTQLHTLQEKTILKNPQSKQAETCNSSRERHEKKEKEREEPHKQLAISSIVGQSDTPIK